MNAPRGRLGVLTPRVTNGRCDVPSTSPGTVAHEVVLLPLVLLPFAFGHVDVIRGYFETWTLVALLAVPTVTRLLGVESVRPRPLPA